LIGAIVCDGERVDCHSFWADDGKHNQPFSISFLTLSHATTPRRSIAMAATRGHLSSACGAIHGVRSTSIQSFLR
jgi:hypothetical protein